ncbi:sulfatase-like hydrolase/transferase [Aquicoccus sp. SCR17]|nr:sulfatase-like hydrolase/transferase [Carideicomes alvinocaridis]
MGEIRNILFIMFDQLRWDYLGCYGHPHLETPNLDRLAARGVRFDRARIQSPICGSSRMSTYTGRYVQSHGATGNGIPLKVGEMTMGDHLRRAGMSCHLVGKTHMRADAEGLARLGIAPDSLIGVRLSECGFDVVERDDGMRPEGPDGLYDAGGAARYNDYLRDRGYPGDNPWHDFANSGRGAGGELLSGWFLGNAAEPANIAEQDSETPYLTRRAIEWMEGMGDSGPWCCHLSYIKPHWPYIVPAPYHDMYGPEHVVPPVRSQAEYDGAQEVLRAFMDAPVGRAFSRPELRDPVVRAYMGLIKQCDDQMGVLFDYMERSGRMKDTMIVATSDHGDFLGDHWLGEKMFFHDASVKVPLIVYDPSTAADVTRGSVCDALVESIDLAPTFVEAAGAEVPGHILEGESLLPLLHGTAGDTRRDYVICEYDYSTTPLAAKLGLKVEEAAIFMVADARWKLVHFEGGFPPILFDMVEDPQELRDLGRDPAHAEVVERMYDKLFRWARRNSQRTTRSHAELEAARGKSRRLGVLIGVGEEDELPQELTVKYRGRQVPDMRGG